LLPSCALSVSVTVDVPGASSFITLQKEAGLYTTTDSSLCAMSIMLGALAFTAWGASSSFGYIDLPVIQSSGC
jgi:hypothetical protein